MNNRKYDYSQVEQISGLEYKYSLIAIGLLVGLQFNIIPISDGSAAIILKTGLSLFVWWSFRQYFVKVNDMSTAKWLLIIISIFILYGIANLAFYWSTNLFENNMKNEALIPLFKGLFYLVMFSLIAFILVCFKILTTNKNHSFPLQGIALSSAIFIPLFILFSSISNFQYIWQLKNIVDGAMSDPTGGMLTPPDFIMGIFSSIKFFWNILVMLPYYFLFMHFYRADKYNSH